MTRYIYDHENWPNFRWDSAALETALAETGRRQGRLVGRLESVASELQDEANLDILTLEALKSSEIEGETLNRDEVRSSVARRLGFSRADLKTSSRHVDGLVSMLVDATQAFDEPLTAERLFGWHAGLFPDEHRYRDPKTVGGWRTGPIYVTSERHGREVVHFEGPPAERVAAEMADFLAWFEDPTDRVDPLIKAAIAHIRFVTIHPFDDGNGRIARAIADLALARSESTGRRFYSVSARLRNERAAYYDGLEAAQKGDLDVTRRIEWFLKMLNEAFDHAETTLGAVVRKARFWRELSALSINGRQRDMLHRLIDGAFVGHLTTSKWAQLSKCSSDTALRDIEELVVRGVLQQSSAGGRSTHYVLREL